MSRTEYLDGAGHHSNEGHCSIRRQGTENCMVVRSQSITSRANDFPAHSNHDGPERFHAKARVMNFLEAPRLVTEEELRDNDITRYHVTGFYREQIRKSGYYDQLKYIVEPSLKEFDSPGSLDTSGEHDNTVVAGVQHKHAAHGRLADTDRFLSYSRD